LGGLLGVGGTVNPAAMARIVRDFQSMGTLNRVEQRTFTERRLTAVGLRPSATEVKNQGGLGKQSIASWFCWPLVPVGVRFLGVRGGVNHAVAVNVYPGKESFFDPNLGEFQFLNRRPKMEAFLHAHIFPMGSASGIGTYIGRPTKAIEQIE